MKKFYLLMLLVSILFTPKSNAQVITSEADPSYIMLGYNEVIGQIYQYDGIGGTDDDGTVGCAARITSDMLKRYPGAKITALNIGWSNPDTPGKCTLFVRNAINGVDVASAEGTLSFGWNEIKLSKSITIPDNPKDLYIGYFVDVPANTICIPTFYPKNIKGSCLLWRDGETDNEGNNKWTDMSADFGSIALQARVEEPTDKFYNMVDVTDVNYYTMQVLDEETRFDFSVKNHGMNDVYNVMTRFEKDGKTYDVECSMPAPLYPGCTADVHGKMKALGSGSISFKLTEIDGAPNQLAAGRDLNVMTMPRAVADKYRRTPMIEFFESEGINIIPKYYNEFFLPGYQGFEDDIILVQHHVGDGYTVGNDESLRLMLDMMDNDSTLITVPVMMLDRTNYIDMPVKFDYKPMFSILFPDFARPMYEFARNMPTFASVNIETTAGADEKSGTVTVSGNIEDGILPEGENLYITTYLVAGTEYSGTQQFLSQEELDQYCDPESKLYPHHNLLKQSLTPMFGEELDVHSGSYSRTYQFTLNKYDDINNIYAVSFLTRGAKNKDRFNRYVLNACRRYITGTNGIDNASASDVKVSVKDGRITVEGSYDSYRVYDVTGAQTTASQLSRGIYIVKVSTAEGLKTTKIFINK